MYEPKMKINALGFVNANELIAAMDKALSIEKQVRSNADVETVRYVEYRVGQVTRSILTTFAWREDVVTGKVRPVAILHLAHGYALHVMPKTAIYHHRFHVTRNADIEVFNVHASGKFQVMVPYQKRWMDL